MNRTIKAKPKPKVHAGGRVVQRVFCFDHNRQEVSVQWIGTGSEYPFCDVRPIGDFTGTNTDGSVMSAEDVQVRLANLSGVEITTDGEVV